MANTELYIGLMSGTSADSIDAALLDFGGDSPQLLAQHCHPISNTLKQQILSLCQPDDNELDRLGELDRILGQHFADAALALLDAGDYAASQICAIGSHGQTVRHRPPGSCEHPFTVQIGDPNTIAEQTGITTIADFRRRDIAVGGQGAPLAPAFHQAAFSAPGKERFVINIGGMANLTHLPVDQPATGYDTGPGNVLLDAWVHQHLGQPYDPDGHWASQGNSNTQLLAQLMNHPFFALEPPKSTGRESFHLAWLTAELERFGQQLAAVDVQATLLELTAQSIAHCVKSSTQNRSEVYICGGGAYNLHLLQRLEKLVFPHSLTTTQELGLAPEWVEAAAFAWLARQTQLRLTGNLPSVTGAGKAVILGGIYSA